VVALHAQLRRKRLLRGLVDELLAARQRFRRQRGQPVGERARIGQRLAGRPSALSCFAVTGSASQTSCNASALGSRRASCQLPPPSGDRPSLACDIMKRASSAATTRSQASTIENAPPAAAPSTAAMTGFGHARSASMKALKRSSICICTAGSARRRSARAAMSPPALKVAPSPCSTIARTSALDSATVSASTPAAKNCSDSVFGRPGSLSVSTSVVPRRSVLSSVGMVARGSRGDGRQGR
jgi:hypothetical protein